MDPAKINIDEELTPYHCCPEWHLAGLTHAPFAALLYPFAFRVAKESGRFHGSVVGIAGYFHVERGRVQRAIKALLDLGFFELVAKEPFQPSSYHVLSHKDWAPKHPGCCAVKETLPWSGEEGDPLGVRLWNASAGKVRYQPYQLAACRNTGLNDDEIVAAFKEFVANEEARRRAGGWHGRWGKVPLRFLRWLRVELGEEELKKQRSAA